MEVFNEYKATITAEIFGKQVTFEMPYLDTNDPADIMDMAYETIQENINLSIDKIEVSGVFFD